MLFLFSGSIILLMFQIIKNRLVWLSLFFLTVPLSFANGEEVNRITTAQGVLDAFNRVVDFAVGIMVTLAVLFIIINGYKFASAGGDEKQIADAKRQIVWSLIAIFLIIVSVSAFRIVGGLITGY